MKKNLKRYLYKSRILFNLIRFSMIVFLCFFTMEIAVRLFWAFEYHVPFLKPGLILYSYYPKLKEVDRIFPTQNDNFYDILLLGGSVLDEKWSSIENEFNQQLTNKGYINYRIFNLSHEAHTSRDSLLKYKSLSSIRFDLVIFYHGINETRTNNIPAKFFKTDYSHYNWYEVVNHMAPYHKKSIFSLPYTFTFLHYRINQIIYKEQYIPGIIPPFEWFYYGKKYSSASSFEDNLKAIIDISKMRNDQLVLLTFAFYVPSNYSIKLFKQKKLDYSAHASPIEIWGWRPNVIGAMKSHNAIVRKYSSKYPNVMFVDQANLIKGSGKLFHDPCHFTDKGSKLFVKNLIDVIILNNNNLMLKTKTCENTHAKHS